MTDTSVLVLNQNYEPLNVCNTRRAFVLLDKGKAEILEQHPEGFIYTAFESFPRPSVIRLIYMIKRPRPQMRLTRREVFVRDRYTCQYCGKQGRDLTIDHVVPRHQGGRHTWENLVSACRTCNHRKAGHTPQEARMALLSEPKRPPASAYYVFYHHLERQEHWRKFIPGWDQYESVAAS